MRHDAIASGMPRAKTEVPDQAGETRWSASEYFRGLAVTTAMIAPFPFFWNPPFWVLALTVLPVRRLGASLSATAAEAADPSVNRLQTTAKTNDAAAQVGECCAA